MKKLLLLLLPVILTSCSLTTTPGSDILIPALNTVIQSDAVQNATFITTDGCTNSVLNDIEFCSLLEVKDSYKESSVDQACVDVCVGYRQTCKTACDVCCGWACNCSSCKSGCDNDYKKCADGCSIFDITGGYDFKLESVTGLGGLTVTNISDPIAGDDPNVYSITITMNIPSVSGNAYYKIWQDPIPAIDGHTSVMATNVPVVAQASLIDKCGDGFYINITSMDITIPDNIWDSNALLEIANMFGMDINYLTGGIVDLNKMLTDWVASFLDGEVTNILNDVLNDYKLADPGC